jgi:hypothetical protein
MVLLLHVASILCRINGDSCLYACISRLLFNTLTTSAKALCVHMQAHELFCWLLALLGCAVAAAANTQRTQLYVMPSLRGSIHSHTHAEGLPCRRSVKVPPRAISPGNGDAQDVG